MKGTEKIISHIEADTKASVDEIIADAKAKCDEINASYEAKAKAAYDQAVAAAENECEDKLEGAKRINSMEEKKSILALKQEMVSSAFNKALELLSKLPDDKYEALMVKLVLRSLQTGDEEVIMNANDAARIGKSVIDKVNKEAGSKLTLSDTHGDFAGGIILKTGNTQVNSTLELLVELSKRDLSPEVVKVLFG